MADTKASRDEIALEVFLVFLRSEGRHRRMGIISKIKFWLNIPGWKSDYDYSTSDCAKKAYQVADIFIMTGNDETPNE